jgi:hypothetical protein
VTFDGDEITTPFFRKAKYTLDPSKELKQMDVAITDSKGEKSLCQAIYLFDRDKLFITLGVIGLEERPDSFYPAPTGRPVIAMRFKRETVAASPGTAGGSDSHETKANPKLTDLYARRLAILNETYSLQKLKNDAGKGSLVDLQWTQQQIIEVKLAMATTPNEAGVIIEEGIRNLDAIEVTAKKQFDVGIMSRADLLQVLLAKNVWLIEAEKYKSGLKKLPLVK